MTDVYLNSKFVGVVDNPEDFTDTVREERRKGNITDNLNIFCNKKADTVEVECSKGRARRPLIVIRDGQPLLGNYFQNLVLLKFHIYLKNLKTAYFI